MALDYLRGLRRLRVEARRLHRGFSHTNGPFDPAWKWTLSVVVSSRSARAMAATIRAMVGSFLGR